MVGWLFVRSAQAAALSRWPVVLCERRRRPTVPSHDQGGAQLMAWRFANSAASSLVTLSSSGAGVRAARDGVAVSRLVRSSSCRRFVFVFVTGQD